MKNLLKKVPLFSNLSDKDFSLLTSGISEIKLKTGEILFNEGEKGDKAYIIDEGEIEIIKKSEDREVLIAITKKGDIIGEIALLDDSRRIATARAKTNSTLFEISKKDFELLLEKNYNATRSILKNVVKRWQETEALLKQSGKMAQIGTLTAGITHELNNPASAIKRGSEQLKEISEKLLTAQKELDTLGLTEKEKNILEAFKSKVVDKARKPDDLDLLSRSEKEEEFESWLKSQNIEDSENLSQTFALVNLDKKDLSSLTKNFKFPKLSIAVSWLCTIFTFYSLLEEVSLGASRISELIHALKSYSFLDQGPVQTVNIHEGLDNTLILLRSKLKEGVEIKRKYAKNLPKIQGYGSELNQVFTNIIDNAADAMNGRGKIEIETKKLNGDIVIRITDNGPGIPAEIQSKIFDPFFTTKEPGKGTGLGLDISYNIIVTKHGGDISVKSKPGETTFEIRLPISRKIS